MFTPNVCAKKVRHFRERRNQALSVVAGFKRQMIQPGPFSVCVLVIVFASIVAPASAAGPATLTPAIRFAAPTSPYIGPTTWQGEAPLGGRTAQKVVAATNGDGLLEIVYIGLDDGLYANWQGGGPGGWHGEMPLGGRAKSLIINAHPDSRLEIFYIGTDDRLYHNWQSRRGSGGWVGQANLGGAAAKSVVAGTRLDGLLEVIYIGTDNFLYHNWEQPGRIFGWHGEEPLEGAARTDSLIIATGTVGTLDIFYLGTDDRIYHDQQSRTGPSTFVWRGGRALGEPGPIRNIVSARNADGRLEIFYIRPGDRIYHNWFSNRAWAGERALGGRAKSLIVDSNADGRLEIFYIGTNDRLYHNWQSSAGSGGWHGEADLGGLATIVISAKNLTITYGQLEIIYIGTDSQIYHNWQQPGRPGGWHGQASLGGLAESMIVASNWDYALEIFYVGTDHHLYHNWQSSD